MERKDIVIHADGHWSHGDTEIINEKVIAYFLSILNCKNGEYFLITDREEERLVVEDTPLFIERAVFYEIEGRFFNCELLLNNKKRLDFDFNNFSLRKSDDAWIYSWRDNGCLWQAKILPKAQNDFYQLSLKENPLVRENGKKLQLRLQEDWFTLP